MASKNIFITRPKKVWTYIFLKCQRSCFKFLVIESGYFSTSVHHCGDDAYHSSIEISGCNSFKISHDVSGPRKKYISVTHFERLMTN